MNAKKNEPKGLGAKIVDLGVGGIALAVLVLMLLFGLLSRGSPM